MSVPPLLVGEAHVWVLPLDEAPDLTGLLSPDERRRAERFVYEGPRRQYTAARGGLRLILGRYLGLAPERIEFTTTGNGKPALVGGEVRFNVSHSGGLALVAVGRDVELGVDVEQVREREGHLDMARRFFTQREVARVNSLEAFYHVWVRKEAFLKALGLGLSHGLERFAVSVPPDDPARILHIDGDEAAGRRWSLVELRPAEGYVGALAAEGPMTVRVERWGW
jgi:4'-phosphopantetheinyl transferase